MSVRKTQEQFLEEAKNIHGDKYDYSRAVYLNTRTPVEIICKRCGRHIFVEPRKHIHHFQGCKYCRNAKTNEQFLEEAKNIHEDKYDYSKVDYKNNHTKVCIICPEHGEFLINPSNHLHGRGCPECAKKIIKEGSSNNSRKSNEEFIAQAHSVHGDKYDYSKINYVKNSEKIEIICPKHGRFWQRPSDHLHGYGCPSCSCKMKLSTDEFVERAKSCHPDAYDYSNVEYVNYSTPVKIKCNVCGNVFAVSPRNFLSSKTECPVCFGTHKLTTNEFIERAKNIHGDKYDYSKTDYKGVDTKICIICPKHGEFWQTPYQHINLKNSCPVCSTSKGELAIKNFFDENNIVYIHDKACLDFLGELRPDFYLPDYNAVVEYDGIQHFEPIEVFGGEEEFLKTKERDRLKSQLCEENNVFILRISYLDFDNIENILADLLKR